MKFVLALIVLSSVSAIAATPQDCFKITNNLDRKYCLDKHIESLKDKMNAEKATWANGISEQDKTAKANSLQQEIQAKKDYMTLMQSEIEIHEKFAEELKSAKVAAVAAPKKAKKKEKKKGFRIKL